MPETNSIKIHRAAVESVISFRIVPLLKRTPVTGNVALGSILSETLPLYNTTLLAVKFTVPPRKRSAQSALNATSVTPSADVPATGIPLMCTFSKPQYRTIVFPSLNVIGALDIS
jgi:hypothetical protein